MCLLSLPTDENHFDIPGSLVPTKWDPYTDFDADPKPVYPPSSFAAYGEYVHFPANGTFSPASFAGLHPLPSPSHIRPSVHHSFMTDGTISLRRGSLPATCPSSTHQPVAISRLIQVNFHGRFLQIPAPTHSNSPFASFLRLSHLVRLIFRFRHISALWYVATYTVNLRRRVRAPFSAVQSPPSSY